MYFGIQCHVFLLERKLYLLYNLQYYLLFWKINYNGFSDGFPHNMLNWYTNYLLKSNWFSHCQDSINQSQINNGATSKCQLTKKNTFYIPFLQNKISTICSVLDLSWDTLNSTYSFATMKAWWFIIHTNMHFVYINSSTKHRLH